MPGVDRHASNGTRYGGAGLTSARAVAKPDLELVPSAAVLGSKTRDRAIRVHGRVVQYYSIPAWPWHLYRPARAGH